jgi:hypothetical protein
LEKVNRGNVREVGGVGNLATEDVIFARNTEYVYSTGRTWRRSEKYACSRQNNRVHSWHRLGRFKVNPPWPFFRSSDLPSLAKEIVAFGTLFFDPKLSKCRSVRYKTTKNFFHRHESLLNYIQLVQNPGV